jgi:hypothetical protein
MRRLSMDHRVKPGGDVMRWIAYAALALAYWTSITVVRRISRLWSFDSNSDVIGHAEPRQL